MITNKEAHSIYLSNGRSVTSVVRNLFEQNVFPEEDSATLQYRYKSLISTRESFRKRNNLETWENMTFYSNSAQTIS